MKIIGYSIIIFSFMLIFFSSSLIKAEEVPNEKEIKTYNEDVTGDGHKETITLYGITLSNDSEYFQDIWAIITFPDRTEKKIPYQGGYQPELTFANMNQVQGNDLIFSSIVDRKNDVINYQLHTIKRNKPEKIELPTQNHINGSFQDKFEIELQISPTEDPEVIDVGNRAKKYIDSGIYNKQGELRRNTSIHPQEMIEYEPVFLSSSKGFGLKSRRQINGVSNSDKLGTIETLWYYEDDKWIILQSKWMQATK